MWARARVDELERELWHGPDADVKQTITQLGIDFGLVTAYTSFVAVDSDRTVGDGKPDFIDQAVHAPEGVNPQMAGARMLKSRRTFSPMAAPSVRGPGASFSGRGRKQGDHLGLAKEGAAALRPSEELEEDSNPGIGCIKRASPEPLAVMAASARERVDDVAEGQVVLVVQPVARALRHLRTRAPPRCRRPRSRSASA